MAIPTELSIGSLFIHDDYVIPLYQRNYAWTQAQVTQLIRDIWDFVESDGNYYIGTLVVHSREIDNRVVFETIDGQQRLTTLNLLLSVLKNEFNIRIDYRYESRLKFDSRPISSDTLKVLADQRKTKQKAPINTRMEQAYLDMTKEIKLLTKSKTPDIQKFTSYLFNKVRILRVEVPLDTDLNHYFEIMNNRGEQLEKHEVLKAELLSHLNNDTESSVSFAMIWDACSDMERYMVFGFEKSLRNELFEADNMTWNYIPKSFNEIKSIIKKYDIKSEYNSSGTSLLNLIEFDNSKLDQKERDPNEETRFNPVINFSNFLLHVLRVSSKNDVPLDDKRLIHIFNEEINKSNNKANFAKEFAYNLIKARFMFDRYIIKREFTQQGDGWSLKSLRLSRSKNSKFYYVNTFEDEEKNRQVIMLLSMFHVSFPQIIYKHWLSGVLNFLQSKPSEINIDDYISYLEKLSNAFYYDRFGDVERDYFEIIFKNNSNPINTTINETHFHKGTDVQNFIFNRLDYMIWKSEIVNQHKIYKINNINQFSFSFRSSVEHYYPQNPKAGAVSMQLPAHILNSFGNLCLISRSKNSELSNYSPLAKAEHYSKSSIIESLKQQLMLRQKDKWDEQRIAEHQKEMISLLNNKK